MKKNGCGFSPPTPPIDLTPPMLINEISKLFDVAVRGEINEKSVGRHGGKFLLFHLAHCDGVSQLELAKKCHLTPPTISVALAKFEDMGFIRRDKDESDLRASRVYLTNKGREHYNHTRAVLDKYDDVLMTDITDEEEAFLAKLLLRMRDNLLKKVSEKENEEII